MKILSVLFLSLFLFGCNSSDNATDKQKVTGKVYDDEFENVA